MNNNPTPDRVTAIYDAIDAFQREHRTVTGLGHAQIRALLAEYLDRALPAVPVPPTTHAVAPAEFELRGTAEIRAALLRELADKAEDWDGHITKQELRRLADEASEAQQQPDTETRTDIQVWPLQRVLTEVRCGSQDWSWEQEWADLDRRHAETGYLAKLEQQIRENGITMPVLIGSDGRLWDGHHRLRLAVRVGIDYVPVEIVPSTVPGPGRAADEEHGETPSVLAPGRVECGVSIQDWWCLLLPGHSGGCVPRRDEAPQ